VAQTTSKRRPTTIRAWVRRAFLLWAVVSTLWLADSYRTRGVDQRLLQSSPTTTVVDGPATLAFLPAAPESKAALIFLCGGGVSARAYAPLLRPIAETGYPVFIVKLPYRFAPFASHKRTAVERALTVIETHPQIGAWVVSGHSLGGALACVVAQSAPTAISAMVLIGTTHPKHDDLSALRMSVTKIYASNDGVAPEERTLSNSDLLPDHTRWVKIEGGNHSQFGHYGRQLLDGSATIRREQQQEQTRAALLDALEGASPIDEE